MRAGYYEQKITTRGLNFWRYCSGLFNILTPNLSFASSVCKTFKLTWKHCHKAMESLFQQWIFVKLEISL